MIAANWKCNGTVSSVTELCEVFSAGKQEGSVDRVIAAGYLHLGKVAQLEGFQLAAQNCVATTGAFTGEIAATQLKDFGVEWVILGHSERRTIYKETDDDVAKKVTAALSAGLKIIACVGESLEIREAGKTMEVVLKQVESICAVIPSDRWSDVVIAYEPVWAIGTGKVATPKQAEEVHQGIRSWIAANKSKEIAAAMRILYGGSVNAGNAAELYTEVVCL